MCKCLVETQLNSVQAQTRTKEHVNRPQCHCNFAFCYWLTNYLHRFTFTYVCTRLYIYIYVFYTKENKSVNQQLLHIYNNKLMQLMLPLQPPFFLSPSHIIITSSICILISSERQQNEKKKEKKTFLFLFFRFVFKRGE